MKSKTTETGAALFRVVVSLHPHGGNNFVLFTENESRFNVRGIMYTKEVHVKRPYKVAEPRISHIQRDNVFG